MSLLSYSKVWPCLLLILAYATLFCNFSANNRELKAAHARISEPSRYPFRSSGEYIDAPRNMVRNLLPPGASLYMLTAEDDSLTSIERSRYLALSWECESGKLRNGGVGGIGESDAVIISKYPAVALPGENILSDFEEAGDCAYATLYLHKKLCGKQPEKRIPPKEFSRADLIIREVFGLLPLLIVAVISFNLASYTGLLGGLLTYTLISAFCIGIGLPVSIFLNLTLCALSLSAPLLLKKYRLPVAPKSNNFLILPFFLTITTALFIILLTLSHTFTAPCGLGIFGGKARLLLLANGIPEGFWNDGRYAPFQPSYPPVLALLTLGAYVTTSCTGEFITQLITPAFYLLLLLFIFRKCHCKAEILWVFSLLTAPGFMMTASQYYAEPLMILCFVVGYGRLCNRKDDMTGWLFVGLAGWIKTEGIIFAFLLWIAVRIIKGGDNASIRSLLIALSIPALWHIVVRLVGATLYDYAMPWQWDAERFAAAMSHFAKEAFVTPHKYAFIYPLTALSLIPVILRRLQIDRREILTVILFAAMSIFAFSYIFSLSTAPDFTWHIETAAYRLLQLPAVMLIIAVLSRHKTSDSVVGDMS